MLTILLLFILFGLFAIAIYFIPTFVAIARHHKHTTAIFLLNFFAGWTFLGWVAALVWSLVS